MLDIDHFKQANDTYCSALAMQTIEVLQSPLAITVSIGVTTVLCDSLGEMISLGLFAIQR